MTEINPNNINCQEACVNGCILGDRCPNLQYLQQARQFIQSTSVDKMLEISAERFNKPPTAPELKQNP